MNTARIILRHSCRLPCVSVSPAVNKVQVRYLNKSSMQPRREGKHYRLWAMPGDRVMTREVLAKQFIVKWHPGLNAGIDEDRTIYALTDGIMVISEERFDPDWDSPQVKQIYGSKEEEKAPLYKRYINVVPDYPQNEFKLIDVV